MNNKYIPCTILVAFLFIHTLTGCGHYLKPVDDDFCKELIPFLEDGKTTKQEAIQKLPLQKFYLSYISKNTKILIYKIFYKEKNTSYDLVLIFNEIDVLVKHSLVKTS